MNTSRECARARAAVLEHEASQAARLAAVYTRAGNYSGAAYWRQVEAAHRAAAARARRSYAGATRGRPCLAA